MPRRTRAKADLSELIDTLGLAGTGGDYPGELSLGLARRVAIARAFAIDPDFLLLDEPFVSLDRALHARLRALLALRIGAKKMTALIATHDLDDALLLADEVIFLAAAQARITGRLPIGMPRKNRDENLTELRALNANYQVITLTRMINPHQKINDRGVLNVHCRDGRVFDARRI